MLVQKSTALTEGEVFGFRLITGEEMICKVCSVSDTEIVVHAPLQLVTTPDGGAFAPVLNMIADGNDPTFYKTNLLAHYVPADNLKTAYESAISEIILPQTSGIIV